MHPDFSGTWEADLSKSRLVGAAPDRITVQIDHRDPRLTQTVLTAAAGQEQRLQFAFTTDGRDSSNSIGGASGISRARWLGEELEIESTITLAGRDRRFRDYWSLSPNGQFLTMAHRDDDLAGQVTVLEKMP